MKPAGGADVTMDEPMMISTAVAPEAQHAPPGPTLGRSPRRKLSQLAGTSTAEDLPVSSNCVLSPRHSSGISKQLASLMTPVRPAGEPFLALQQPH